MQKTILLTLIAVFSVMAVPSNAANADQSRDLCRRHHHHHHHHHHHR